MISLPDIDRIDTQDMRGFIRKMPDHMRHARELAMQALSQVTLPKSAWSNIVVCGIGGSAIAGDLVRSYLTELATPIIVVRGYKLPAIVNDRSLIVISSYSGNTEESLTLFEQAVARKLHIVAISTGGKLAERCATLRISVLPQKAGMQPRAAMAYGFVPLLSLLEHLGLVTDQSSMIESAAAALENLVMSEDNVGSSSYTLAHQLIAKIAIVYSADDIIGAVGTRWRGQLQENAKHLAYSSVLPEMNHNEINAWQHPADLLDRMHVVLLRSPADEHERVALRFSILQEYLAKQGVQYSEVHATGETRLARMFSLIAMGDWTSYWLAIQTNTDPTPIPAIDYLKQRLS